MKKNKNLITLILVLIGLFLSSIEGFPVVEASQGIVQNDVITNSMDDLKITFNINQSTIGKFGGIEGALTLNNTGINPIGNVEVNFNLSNNFLRFTSKFPVEQNVSLINENGFETLNIEVELNATMVEESAADIVLLFDSSGSMGDELTSLKAEFLNVVDRLSQGVPSLRMGMVVYGWSKYSEYPTASTNNYVNLTSDVGAIYNLINELSASGGKEPWGDAFWLINQWDWRMNVPKLAIIIGDEDCDPGQIVGVGQSGNNYNGSQLLNVITSLKEKKVKINSVITGISGIVENQFQWIANYTGGNYVYLDELLSGEDPVNLPELIEHWTMELTRELFSDLSATINWTEFIPGENQDYSATISKQIMIDLAPPSITVSTLTSEISSNNYQLEVTILPKDFSGIEQVNMYWCYDLFTSPTEPTWHFKMFTNKIGEYYIETLTNLRENDIISFYIEASDTLFNIATTKIYNISIAFNIIPMQTVTEFFITQDNSTRYLYFNFISYMFNYYAEQTTGYLWIEANQLLDITIQADATVNYQEEIIQNNYTIIKLTQATKDGTFRLTIHGDTSVSPIKIRWDFSYQLINSSFFDVVFFQLNLDNRLRLIEVNLVSNEGVGYLSLIPLSGDLLAYVYIFDENWNRIGRVYTLDPIELSNGKYFLWVEHYLREGSFTLYYGPDRITATETYYTITEQYGYHYSLIMLGLIGVIALMQIISKMKRRRI